MNRKEQLPCVFLSAATFVKREGYVSDTLATHLDFNIIDKIILHNTETCFEFLDLRKMRPD